MPTRIRWDVRVTVQALDAVDAEDASRTVIVDSLPDEWLFHLILKRKGPRIFTHPPGISEIPGNEMSKYVQVFRYEAEEADSPPASGDPYKRFRVGGVAAGTGQSKRTRGRG